MKIKRERQVRLDELVDYITKNELVSSVFKSNRGNEIVVDINGDLNFFGRFNYNDLFTITEEVEITEDMRLNLVVIDDDYEVTTNHYTKISQILKESETYGYEIKFIYLQNDDGQIGELIWDKERGLID